MTWSAASLPSNNLTLVFLKNGTNYNLQFLNVTLAAEYFPNIYPEYLVFKIKALYAAMAVHDLACCVFACQQPYARLPEERHQLQPSVPQCDARCGVLPQYLIKPYTQQWLSMTWSAASLSSNNLTLVFLKNGTNYNLQFLNVTLAAEYFPNISSNNPIELSYGPAWQTPLATSYRCGPPTDLNMTADHNNAGKLTMSQLQEEAFRTSSGKAFSAARDCGSGDVPDAWAAAGPPPVDTSLCKEARHDESSKWE
ncbi:lysosome-associated membrane glycoprotein (Lamp) domain-containing protein [Phthorimaea operculella]|nr:lysosome-associated membrane glycoprotein (Lamp) domain-containing protein [Phthorimaea operculella]